jgi:arginase
MQDTSCGPLAADDLAVLSYAQWQGADHANRERYEAGAEAVRREIERLIPPERAYHHQVTVSSVLEPERGETGPRAWSCIARQQRYAFDLLARTAPTRAITLGGDCGIEPASIGYFNARHNGNIALLWLDSHGDLNSNTESPSGNYHGMALRDLIEPGMWV